MQLRIEELEATVMDMDRHMADLREMVLVLNQELEEGRRLLGESRRSRNAGRKYEGSSREG